MKPVFLLQHVYLGGNSIELVSSDVELVVSRTINLAHNLRQFDFDVERAMPFNRGFSDAELRKRMRSEFGPLPKSFCEILVFNNDTGNLVDRIIADNRISNPELTRRLNSYKFK